MDPFLSNLKLNLKKHQLRVGQYLSAHGASEYTILIIFSLILGTVAGLSAVGFHESIALLQHLALKNHSAPFWLIIVLPVIGMLIQYFMVKVAPKESRQKGVLEVIKSVSLYDGKLSPKATLFHFLAPAVCIGSGCTVGPEAPAAQTGAGVVSALGRILGLSESRLRMFTAAGAGAAIAGVFNTPLAGVFFALEVILLNEFRATALSVFLLSSVSASAVSRIFLGNDPKFIFDTVQLGSYQDYIFYLLLGLGAGLLSILFIKSKESVHHSFARIYKRYPLWTGMVAAGLIMGLAGFMIPDILGIGYDAINNMLAQTYTPKTISMLFVLKFALVVLILGAGGFGGIFAPSMFMGACFGYLFAVTASTLFNLDLHTTTFTLVGMGAMLAGVNSVPITAIMILFEMTNDYHFILPLILGIVGSHTITQMAMNGSIYAKELAEEGYEVGETQEKRILCSIPVEHITRKSILLIPENTPISELIHTFLNDEEHDTIYITNKAGSLTGVIHSSTLHHLITSYHTLEGMVIAKDIADESLIFVNCNDNLEMAMRIFASHHIEEIPVLKKDGAENKILGVLHYQDVLNIYNQKIGKISLRDELAVNVKSLQKDKIMEAVPGFSIAQVTLPDSFINKSLSKLNLRNKYNIDVLMVERLNLVDMKTSEAEKVMPHKDMVFMRGDKLLIYGKSLDVVRFKQDIK